MAAFAHMRSVPKSPELVYVCLFVWFDSLRPINNLSVKQGRVFLGWTSTKLGLMCLAQWPQRSDAGEARTPGPSVSSQALYHWATVLPSWCMCWYIFLMTGLGGKRKCKCDRSGKERKKQAQNWWVFNPASQVLSCQPRVKVTSCFVFNC